MVGEARRREVGELRQMVVAWAESERRIAAVVLVGSWAADRATEESDVDVVVLTDDIEWFVSRDDWFARAIGSDAELVRTADWGALQEVRVRAVGGLEIEFGFARPSWAATDPVDAGTHRVIGDGAQPWYDPAGTIADLISAVRG